MMRPQARILFALLTLILLMSVAAHGQTLLPFIVDASGSLQEVKPTAEPSEEPGAEMTSGDVPPADSEGDEEQTPTDEEEQTPADEQEASEPEKPATPPLSPEMATFRDHVRRTLSQVYSRSLNAQSSLPAEVMAFCEAFGHTAEIASGSRSRQKLNAVGTMCWNYPCGGYKLLRTDGNQIVARVGYGYQQRPAQLLAVLALTRVPESYEVRIGDHHGTVADLVTSEKLACRQGLDQSAALIGLAFYTEPGETWENDLGDTWSVERLLQEELDRKADASRVDVVHRLMAISFAVKQQDAEDVSTEGVIERAEKHIEEFLDFVLGLQNSDGTWHPGFLAYRGASKDTAGSLFSTGAILTWLVYSLPEDRLEDERVVLGLTYLNKQLANRMGRRSATPSSSHDVIGQMNAARALSLYDVRYFTPRTPPEPVEESGADEAAKVKPTTQGASTAGRSPSSSSTRSQSRSSSQRRR
jgi:hypothetical protein